MVQGETVFRGVRGLSLTVSLLYSGGVRGWLDGRGLDHQPGSNPRDKTMVYFFVRTCWSVDPEVLWNQIRTLSVKVTNFPTTVLFVDLDTQLESRRLERAIRHVKFILTESPDQTTIKMPCLPYTGWVRLIRSHSLASFLLRIKWKFELSSLNKQYNN